MSDVNTSAQVIETYVSIDIEADGPSAGLSSLLALGAAAFVGDRMVATFYETLHPRPDGTPDAETMRWWTTQPEAWMEVATGREDPATVANRFVVWLEGLPGEKIAVGMPASMDFEFVNYYCWRYVGRNPLNYNCVDVRSFANGIAGVTSYYGLPDEELQALSGHPDVGGLRPHVAIDDAIWQGRLFVGLQQRVSRRQ